MAAAISDFVFFSRIGLAYCSESWNSLRTAPAGRPRAVHGRPASVVRAGGCVVVQERACEYDRHIPKTGGVVNGYGFPDALMDYLTLICEYSGSIILII